MENKLYLHFKDNKKRIEFDLNKNTVFFGNNGQGKTRILKTINALYLLAREKRTENSTKIIDSMNLKNLKINDVTYNELFSVNEYLKINRQKSLFLYFKENKKAFEQLELIMHEIPREIIYELDVNTRFSNILNYLKKCINVYSLRNGNPSSSGFTRWLNDSYSLMIRSRNSIVHNKFDFDSMEILETPLTNIEEAINLISYLREKHQFLNIYSQDDKEVSKITKKREAILKSLSIKSSHYITTDSIDILNVNKKIEIIINSINEDLKSFFWFDLNVSNYSDKIASLVVKRDSFYSKIKKFNEFIKKYANIEISIEKGNEITFKKNGEEMIFEKLSSGERKISFLFLEIIFNDVDIYLVDEPELSLSLDFQNKIITDLHLLTKGKTLFIATHAPYIYEDFIAIEGNISKEV